jgi:hypothetical protein
MGIPLPCAIFKNLKITHKKGLTIKSKSGIKYGNLWVRVQKMPSWE